MSARPEWVKALHDSASETMRQVTSGLLETATLICADESRESKDGVTYIPIIVMAAVHEETLIASPCQFGRQSSCESVARLLHLTADHLEGKTHDGQFVAERRLVR